MKLKEAVSKRVIGICEERGITPNRLSEMSTVPSSTLRDLINCHINNPSSYVIYQICKALNISLEEFFNNELFDFKNIED